MHDDISKFGQFLKGDDRLQNGRLTRPALRKFFKLLPKKLRQLPGAFRCQGFGNHALPSGEQVHATASPRICVVNCSAMHVQE